MSANLVIFCFAFLLFAFTLTLSFSFTKDYFERKKRDISRRRFVLIVLSGGLALFVLIVCLVIIPFGLHLKNINPD